VIVSVHWTDKRGRIVTYSCSEDEKEARRRARDQACSMGKRAFKGMSEHVLRFTGGLKSEEAPIRFTKQVTGEDGNAPENPELQ